MKPNIKILVVDDDRASAQAIAEIVQRQGFKTAVVAKPADALNIAKLQTIHAAVVDVLLPKMSGVDLAREFRRTKFGDNPVILVSGVFKDKTFATESIAECGAVDFLFKPFGADELAQALNAALAPILTSETWNVQSLLTRRLKSPRDRQKAVERLDRIGGPEFPFVLSLLTDAKISGHLNIVSDTGEIFGVTLSHGTIAEVDSSESQSTGVYALLSNGFLSTEDWEAFAQGGRRKFSLDRLVQEGLVSPHAVTLARSGQIIEDLKTIFSAEQIQVNFVRQDDVGEPPGGAVTMRDLLLHMSGVLDEFFPRTYLETFYTAVADAKLLTVGSAAEMSSAWSVDTSGASGTLREALEQQGTLTDVLKKSPKENYDAVYTMLHFMVLNRFVIFEDAARTQDLASLLERYQNMYAQLAGMAPDQIFAYFGGGENLTPVAAERIFAEYERSNLPQSLPRDATPALIELCQKCHQLVASARTIMVDPEQREKLLANRKIKEKEDARLASEMQVKGLGLMRQGNYQSAMDTLREAERLNRSAFNFILRSWAEAKGGVLQSRDQMAERLREIESLPTDDRRSTYYHVTVGTLKKAMGDRSCLVSFQNALDLDSSMIEASREINAARAFHEREKKQDILTGDITSIITGFFRRKAD